MTRDTNKIVDALVLELDTLTTKLVAETQFLLFPTRLFQQKQGTWIDVWEICQEMPDSTPHTKRINKLLKKLNEEGNLFATWLDIPATSQEEPFLILFFHENITYSRIALYYPAALKRQLL